MNFVLPISVVIPTYRRPELLQRSLNSVLSQGYENMEVLVIDDDLDQSGRAIVDRISDMRVRYLVNDSGIHGGGATRNVGIRASAGEWVFFQDDDDVWVDGKLKYYLDVIPELPSEVGFIFSALINDDGRSQSRTHVPSGVHDFSFRALSKFNGFLTSTLAVRRQLLDKIGGFDDTLPSHQDPDLVIRLTQLSKGYGIDHPLVVMNMSEREHIGSSIERKLRGREMLLEKHAPLFQSFPKVLSRHYFQLGVWYHALKQESRAFECFMLSARLGYSLRACLHALRAYYLFIISRHDT